MPITETEALVKVCEAMEDLEAPAKQRIIDYVAARYSLVATAQPPRHQPSAPPAAGGPRSPVPPVVPPEVNPSAGPAKEIPGIARLTDAGEFKLVVRDLKASSVNDAARRVAYMAILAIEQLTGRPGASSRKVVTPQLQAYRCYTSNSRTAIRGDKGIHRNGDTLTLDAHARQEAEQWMSEVLNDTVKGAWKPGTPAAKARNSGRAA